MPDPHSFPNPTAPQPVWSQFDHQLSVESIDAELARHRYDLPRYQNDARSLACSLDSQVRANDQAAYANLTSIGAMDYKSRAISRVAIDQYEADGMAVWLEKRIERLLELRPAAVKREHVEERARQVRVCGEKAVWDYEFSAKCGQYKSNMEVIDGVPYFRKPAGRGF